jgi:hypothetical protein
MGSLRKICVIRKLEREEREERWKWKGGRGVERG